MSAFAPYLGVTRTAGGAEDEASIRLPAEGLLAENFSRQSVVSASILTDGTVYYVALGLNPSPITNVIIAITTGGVSMSLSRVGLYTAAGALVASSADQGSAWESNGCKVVPLSTPYRGNAGLYYVGILAKTSSSMPTVARGTSLAQVAGALPGGLVPFAVQDSQTDLPTTAVFSTGTFAPWVGVS